VLIGLPGQGDETYRQQVSGSYIAFLVLIDQDKILNHEGASHGDNHSAVIFKLCQEGRRDMTGCCGYYNSIKRSMFIPAVIAISYSNFNVIIP
jgi:hypothetical protein